MGLIIGVPLFVLVYSIAKEYLEARLKDKGLPANTVAYYEEGVIQTQPNSDQDVN